MIEYIWFTIAIISGLMSIHYFSNAFYPRSYPDTFNNLDYYYSGFDKFKEVKS